MTKKGHQNCWRMKIGNFFGNRSNWQNFSPRLKIFGNRGESETRGKFISASEGWTPLRLIYITIKKAPPKIEGLVDLLWREGIELDSSTLHASASSITHRRND